MRRVVITGIGALTPIGNNVVDYWNNLKNGVSGIDFIKSIADDRIEVKLDAELKNYDPIAMGLEPQTVRRTDKFTQYAMIAAREAWNDSKLEIEPERLGVYIGTGVGGLWTIISENDKMRDEGPKWVSPFLIPSIICNIASSNVAIDLHAQGPNIPIVCACATSGISIGEAYYAILAGRADAIIAGGTEAPMTEIAFAGFANCKALTKSTDINAASLPFDKRRSGFIMGEGAGVLVLEEYEHAKARNAKIYAEICGYGTTCDANHITAPIADGSIIAGAIKQAVTQAHISSDDVLYVNAHGTGTVMNDVAETKALKLALGEEAAYKAHISSNKSMIGHLLGAAGAVELIATALTVYEGIIPPTINLNEPDPECDLDYTPNKAQKADITLAISNSFGFGGQNACLAIRKS